MDIAKKILQKYFDFIRRLIFKETEENSVGLDIGAGECKLVEIQKVGDSFKLLNWAVEPVLANDLASAIKKILAYLKTPCKAPYTAVFGKGTLIRYVDITRMNINDLRQAFTMEADKYFPFPSDQIYTDCFILDNNVKGKLMPVMAVAAKKTIIDARVKLLTDLGVGVNFVGVNPIALANVLNVLGFKEDVNTTSAIALLDLGESISNLTILVDRLPRFSRDIFIGGRDFTNRIANALGVSFEEAEKIKRVPGERLQEMARACESAVMNIIQELKFSFAYFATEKNCEISKLLLTGGGSMLEGITNIFEKNLEIKTLKWDPFEKIIIDSNIPNGNPDKKTLKLGVALGLALYSYD